MKNKEVEVEGLNKNLQQITEETEDLRDANLRLEKECEKAQDEYKDLC